MVRPSRANFNRDSVGWFLAAAGRIPMLTKDEEIMLARQVQAMQLLIGENPDEPRTKAEQRVIRIGQRAKDRMITANMRLVVCIAKKYTNSVKVGNLGFDDLIQEGMLGLIRGIEKFDPERGYKLSTYAYWWVRQSITRAIDSTSSSIRLPVHVREMLNKLRMLTNRYEQQNGRPPTQAEIMDELGITTERLDELLVAARSITSLNRELTEDGTSLIDMVIGNDSDPLQQLIEEQEGFGGVTKAMGLLSPRQIAVLQHHYGLNGEERKNLTTIGQIIGEEGDPVSRERVRQIKQSAILKLHALTARSLAGQID